MNVYLSYVKELRFDQKPDYEFLIDLFLNLLFTNYRGKMKFDWICQMEGKPFEDDIKDNEKNPIDLKFDDENQSLEMNLNIRRNNESSDESEKDMEYEESERLESKTDSEGNGKSLKEMEIDSIIN